MPVNVDEKFFGYDGFIWFVGVIEDLNDPEQVSRVRVRVIGHHTENKKAIKTEDLPWAQVMMPTTSASISGIGHSPHGLVKGSYVFGFFMDGEYAQQPVIMGTWHGVPQELADKEKGFNDPDGVYPTEKDEPDTNKLARGENTIKDIIDESIANPESPYAAEYPHNKVYQTTSGHIFEIDDTPDAERIRLYHKSGTRQEIHPNGDKVEIVGDNYHITLGNDKARVTGSLELYVDNVAKVEVGNNAFITVDGDTNLTVGGTTNALIGKDLNAEVVNNVDMVVGGNVTSLVRGDVTSVIEGHLTATVEQNAIITVNQNANIKVAKVATVDVPTTNWTGDINLTGDINQTGDINLTGTSTASGDHVSAGISGKGHTHTISGGSSAGTTSGPN